ncbi:anti-sigma factor [Microbacterium sp. Root180]|uniref:anti-sigma factor n=1 Tax=Microbacterium sp. Root180 TaxID=1736483 RepID=UPI0006F2C542|nr:anti-sigma factor [Microbacterium sp. Root180]KRB36600.1 hypothetical protein ASD93_11135 [Microbacterium sp. Root180]
MSHHLDPERLSLVALGDALSADEAAHLATCDDCSLELAELEYTVTVGRSTHALGELEVPPERVWGRISDELGFPDTGAAVGAPLTNAAEASPAAPSRGRGLRVLVALAASVAAVLAVVGVWSLVRPADPVELASATLGAFPDHPGAVGTAVVTESADGERQVTVELDGSDAADGYREVWLITADASDLVSLGVLEGSEGVFDIPDDVDLSDFVLVDVSQEPEDGDPAHSGDSIVRGELDFV